MKFLHSPLTEVVLNMKNLCRRDHTCKVAIHSEESEPVAITEVVLANEKSCHNQTQISSWQQGYKTII